MTAPAMAPEATIPTRGLCPRQQNHLIHIIAEIAHQGSSPNHVYTVSALLSDDEPNSVFDVEDA